MGPISTTDAMMHPDSHLLHNHNHNHVNASGGRLQADALRFSTPKEERVSPERRFSTDTSMKHSICDMERLDVRKMSGHDELSDARSSSVSSYVADSVNKEQDDDQMSYCSDESELSVGKEVDDEQHKFEHQADRTKGSEGFDSETNDEQLMEKNASMEESAAEQSRYPGKVANVIRPSPTRLQEEFLRKSQLYAEELMKHQMNFMAATRGLNISPKISEHNFGYPVRPETVSPIRAGDDQRSGFRPHIRISADLEKKWSTIEDRSSQSPEATNFRGIHSHLNAISRITSALGRDMVNLTSPCSMTSRENSLSPPNNIHQMINNNINDSNLKFSIDNILKPGFGASRRITDPLLKRNKNSRKNTQRSAETRDKHGTPMDLTAPPSTTMTVPNASTSPASLTSEQDKVTSTNNAATNSTGTGAKSSGGPMVWPAWVYCTRYSDRPSSGKSAGQFKCFVFLSVLFECLKSVIYCGSLAERESRAGSRVKIIIFFFKFSMPAMLKCSERERERF